MMFIEHLFFAIPNNRKEQVIRFQHNALAIKLNPSNMLFYRLNDSFAVHACGYVVLCLCIVTLLALFE